MHTYRQADMVGGKEWLVEFLTTGIYRLVKKFPTEQEAAFYVNYLNGGNSSVDVMVHNP